MKHSELIKGTLSTLILKLLEDKGKMYGYEIAQEIKQQSSGQIQIKEGSLYPALHKLEADGHVWAEEVFLGKRIRRYYHLTQKGKTQSTADLNELRQFLSTISSMVSPKNMLTS